MNSAAWYRRIASARGVAVFDLLLDGIPDFPLTEIKNFGKILDPGQIWVIVQRLAESEQVYRGQAREAFKNGDFERAARLAANAQAMNRRAAQWRQLISEKKEWWILDCSRNSRKRRKEHTMTTANGGGGPMG